MAGNDPAGVQIGHGTQDEHPLGHSGMWHLQAFVIDTPVTVQQDIEIQRSGPPTPGANASPVPFQAMKCIQ